MITGIGRIKVSKGVGGKRERVRMRGYKGNIEW